MPFPHFDPVLIHLGPLSIRWYAVAYIAGILIGWRYGVALTRNAGLWRGAKPTADEKQIDDLVLWLTVAILVGGRLGSILFYNTSVIWTEPLEIFQPWHGGMSFHGAFLAVVLVVLWFSQTMVGERGLRHELCDNFCHRYISCLKGKMPIDLVIDERESPGTTPVGSGNGGGSLKGGEGGGGVGSGLPGDSNNNANRSSNADSTSHTDGASTPDMVRNKRQFHIPF